MSARFEVVRGDGKQAWHARLVSNGRVLMSSETYARRVGAERAIVSTARALGVPVDHLAWNVVDVEKVLRDQWCVVISQAPLVRYFDERSGS